MFENPRRGRQAKNFGKNVPKIADLKSSIEQIFSENCPWVPLFFLKGSLVPVLATKAIDSAPRGHQMQTKRNILLSKSKPLPKESDRLDDIRQRFWAEV